MSLILFAVSAVMIAAGMLIHSVFLPPSTMTQSITLSNPAPITVIDTTSLNRISSTQTISVQGGASGTVFIENADAAPTATTVESEKIVMAWGRKPDVIAFIGNVSYQEIVARGEEGTLVEKKVVGTEVSTPDPAGSDLWIEEFEAEKFLARDVTIPKGNLLVIATDGALPAPKTLTITWKMNIDKSVPTNLFYGGLILAIVGGVFYLLGWWTDRRKHRHRQGRMPRRPRPPRWRPARTPLARTRRHGRRALPFIALVLALPVVLSGCSLFPPPVVEPIPTSPASPRGVAVTAQQVDQILAKLRATLTTADEQRAENVASTRLDGAALRFRVAQYNVQRKDKTLGATFVIPEGRVRLLLPQRTSDWPRAVFAVIDDASGETAPSVAVVLTQANPRDNYKVSYSVALEPGAVIPSVAAAESGAAVIRGETELLSVTPTQAVERYGDLLRLGDESPYATLFDPDSLQTQIGAESKAKRARELGKTARFKWNETIAEDLPIVFATADAAGIVAVTLQESEIVKPASAGASITATGAVKILAGITSSMKGIEANYQYQLLFYIPALGSSDKIRLLGFSYALTSARRLGK
ncbi:MAG: hypothetical protein NWS64_01750 [Microbacteriaceae bacterium]|nr:hypothetical protein [Microbacteriaceae bacterium]